MSKKMQDYLVGSKKSSTFASAFAQKRTGVKMIFERLSIITRCSTREHLMVPDNYT